MALSAKALMRTMPKVGDRMKKKPHHIQSEGELGPSSPLPCTVVYVNAPHLWYMVQFKNGRRECYKVPEINVGGYGRLPRC